MSREGLLALRSAWLALAAGAATLIATLAGSHAYRTAEESNRNRAREQLSRAESLVALAQRERDFLASPSDSQRHLALWQSLAAEDRLGLVERLHELRGAHRLRELELDLAPQGSAHVAGFATQAAAWRASRLRVTLQAAHEGDALAFLRQLSAASGHRLPATDCSLRRLPDEAVGARIEATCRFAWLSVRDPRGS